MSITHVFSLLGGLALFLYGMDLMGKSLERQAGSRLQKILSRLTENPFKGFLLGLAVTAVIQSSSATTVMVVGFVNSGIMQLHQAIGIIMGSNVGTTVTSWLLSLTGIEGDSLLIQLLKPSTFSPLLAFIGILLFMFGGEKKKGAGGILIGFAILMTGMTAMSDAVAPLENEPWFTELFVRFSNPILGVLVGALVTAVIQSSSAQRHPHHHGPEHRHLRHRPHLLGGRQQERPPGGHGPPLLQHHRGGGLSRPLLCAQRGLPLFLCGRHHRPVGDRGGPLGL